MTTIKVGIMPIPDCATVPAAEKEGYFAAEGLRVERVIVQGGGIAMPKLQSGELQFAIMNYVAAIQKEAVAPGTIKLVTDAYQAAPNAFVLMVPGDSPIRSVSELRGKRISVLTLNSVGTLTLEAALKVAGLTKDDVHISEMKVTDMGVAMDRGQIDAAWMTEPFITGYGLSGGRKLADMMDGQTEDLPIAGWATSDEFARANPGTVAAFQRAMLRAQADVASDRQLVTNLLPTYTKIDKNAASSITIGVFPLDLAPSRIQRVADLMREYDYISKKVDVTKLLVPPPPSSTPPSDSVLPSSPGPSQGGAP
ncbi:ABC transporter substrate-binding protein [Nonomuraea ceibae]|uniref:ABC transporter substrate-binding protein n=1 Tax=Nonomuraea ceibae TaxID=1935170 RepID=UPI001FE81655|nr:ABC transporter substrate-binding protein [Nonomuraea ceibae]